MPELALKCIESWHKFMPDYEFKLWNEDNFDINCNLYVKEAYELGKYAFVSDYVRLHALYTEGGIYLDTDVEALKPFNSLLHLDGFIGFEGTKHNHIGTGTIGCIPNGDWAQEQLQAYDSIHFIQPDGSIDLTTNPIRITRIMVRNGLIQNGREQQYKEMRVFATDYFCPRQTTGEFYLTENTYCDHHFMGSWNKTRASWKSRFLSLFSPAIRIAIIKLKRFVLG